MVWRPSVKGHSIPTICPRSHIVQTPLLSDYTFSALQGCLELTDFCDIVAFQAVMNSLPVNPEDFYSSSTTFSERCLEHFCRVYKAPPKRSALALCRLMACQEFDGKPRPPLALVDASAALKPYLARHEKASRHAFELAQLHRSSPTT